MTKLAIDRGKKARGKPFPPWPYFDADEIHEAERVLKSGKVNQWTGVECENFAHEFARYIGVPYCIPLMNGTIALELVLRTMGIGSGDEVLVTPRSFIASASCVVQVGATPVFIDVDRDSQNIDPEKAEKAITPKTKAILVVHLAGWPADLVRFRALCDKYKLLLIEDCAQSLGASVKGKKTGAWGDASVFSFCQDKIMTTAGEGGMICLKNKDRFKLAWSLKDHGKEYESSMKRNAKSGFRWLHTRIGSNYRMTEIQAAVGRKQLKKIHTWIDTRRRNAQILIDAFSKFRSLRTPVPAEGVFHSYYRLYTFVKPDRLKNGWNRDRIMSAVQAEGIPVFSGSCPEIYREKAFFNSSFKSMKRLPVAKELGETSLSFLVHPTLQASDMKVMADGVSKILSIAEK